MAIKFGKAKIGIEVRADFKDLKVVVVISNHTKASFYRKYINGAEIEAKLATNLR
ncbi:hypothetical protein Syun_012639 [Stephania yunnanensis]|uniref:Uncharacterized protein n=1 Tax=Stephania yunnanensis TaxID=152371 RepID=A0AAP0K0J6_9MAGN